MADMGAEPNPFDPVPFGSPFVIGNEIDYIAAALRQANLAGDHAFTELCHTWLEQNLGTHRAFLTHSCTAALEMCALLLNAGPGDEVIMPSYTFVSTANAFVLRGAVPVFIDIRDDTLTIDDGLIEQAITPRTKAIVPVHYAGVPCAMDVILAIARDRRLAVVEDAAQAFGSTFDGRALGTLGDLGCMSFHETKNVISGEGGALFVNEPSFAERAETIRNKGTDRGKFYRGETDNYTWVDIGSSFLPGEVVAAFLYAQLQQADHINASRRATVARYEQLLCGLADAGRIAFPGVSLSDAGNGHVFYFLTRSPQERTSLLTHLRGAGISAVFHYVPLHSSPAGRRYGHVGSSMAVTDSVAGRLIRLPTYHGLSEGDQERVIDAVWDFYRPRPRAHARTLPLSGQQR